MAARELARAPRARPGFAGDVPDKLSLILLVAANLLPLVGVGFLGWDAGAIVLIYWWENVVTGAYNILKIALVPMGVAGHHMAKLFVIPFFCIHYGGFCAVHGLFLLVLFGLGDPPFPDAPWLGPLVFLQLFAGVVEQLWHSMAAGSGWALAALAVSHGASFAQNYIARGEFRRASINLLMSAPYGRIVAMHLSIIVAGMFVVLFGSPMVLLILLVAIKIAVDMAMHRRAHQRLDGPAG